MSATTVNRDWFIVEFLVDVFVTDRDGSRVKFPKGNIYKFADHVFKEMVTQVPIIHTKNETMDGAEWLHSDDFKVHNVFSDRRDPLRSAVSDALMRMELGVA